MHSKNISLNKLYEKITLTSASNVSKTLELQYYLLYVVGLQNVGVR